MRKKGRFFVFNLLDENNFLHIFLNRLGDIIVSNLLFLLCSIPIVTIGPALTALYHTMLKIVKGNEGKTAKTFFAAFRQNFVQSAAVWLLILLAAIITAADIYYFHFSQSGMGSILYLLSLGVAVILILFTLYIFPVIAAFSGSLGALIKDAFVFICMRFHYAIFITVVTTFPLIMTYQDLKLLPLSAFYWFFLGFGVIAYINSFLFYRLFRPFLTGSEPDA